MPRQFLQSTIIQWRKLQFWQVISFNWQINIFQVPLIWCSPLPLTSMINSKTFSGDFWKMSKNPAFQQSNPLNLRISNFCKFSLFYLLLHWLQIQVSGKTNKESLRYFKMDGRRDHRKGRLLGTSSGKPRVHN